jgi:hypothetical protein
MRDLVFKNLTSLNRQRRILASSEIVDKKGIRSIIHRHFVCIVKEIKGNGVARPLPYLYVLKKHNTKEQKERFFCRIKGGVYAIINGRLFLILFMHSLKISLMPSL